MTSYTNKTRARRESIRDERRELALYIYLILLIFLTLTRPSTLDPPYVTLDPRPSTDLHSPDFRTKAYVIRTLLLCDCSVQQTASETIHLMRLKLQKDCIFFLKIMTSHGNQELLFKMYFITTKNLYFCAHHELFISVYITGGSIKF